MLGVDSGRHATTQLLALVVGASSIPRRDERVQLTRLRKSR